MTGVQTCALPIWSPQELSWSVYTASGVLIQSGRFGCSVCAMECVYFFTQRFSVSVVLQVMIPHALCSLKPVIFFWMNPVQIVICLCSWLKSKPGSLCTHVSDCAPHGAFLIPEAYPSELCCSTCIESIVSCARPPDLESICV